MSTATSNGQAQVDLPMKCGAPFRFERVGSRALHAFTLIELLVVISIIGILAGLVVGLTGLATRKSREARVRIEMTKLISDIENYKAKVGYYPPDHKVLVGGREVGIPAPNQLYYELSGMVYKNNQFYVVGGQDPVNANSAQSWFGTAGFANAARRESDLQFRTEFKSSQVKRIVNPPIDVLVSPVRGPANRAMKTVEGPDVNPWLYVSTSPTNNTDRFDLWIEVIVGGKLMRFSNWERDPVVLSP